MTENGNKHKQVQENIYWHDCVKNMNMCKAQL